MSAANLALRFLLEMATLASVGWCAWSNVAGWPRWLAGPVAALAVALVWGRWVAPASATRLDDPHRLLVELVVFGVGALALVWLDRPRLAAAFVATAVINEALLAVWAQR